MPETSRLRGVLRNRNFSLLWWGEMLSEAGSQVTTIAMPLLVLSLTGSPTQAGLVAVARTIAYPLSVLPAGVLADRIDRRRLMILCAVGRVGAIGSVPLALALGRPPLAQLVLASLVDATLFSAAYVAERGLIGEIVAPEAFADAVTLNEARSAVAALAGPAAGGALFGIARAAPFLADTVSFFGAVLALLGVRVPRRRHGATPAAIGGAFAIAGAGGLLSAGIAGPLRRRLSARWRCWPSPWVGALLMPLFLVLHSALAIGLLIGVMFLPMTLSTSLVVGLRLELTPDRLRSRVQAAAMFIATRSPGSDRCRSVCWSSTPGRRLPSSASALGRSPSRWRPP